MNEEVLLFCCFECNHFWYLTLNCEYTLNWWKFFSTTFQEENNFKLSLTFKRKKVLGKNLEYQYSKQGWLKWTVTFCVLLQSCLSWLGVPSSDPLSWQSMVMELYPTDMGRWSCLGCYLCNSLLYLLIFLVLIHLLL